MTSHWLFTNTDDGLYNPSLVTSHTDGSRFRKGWTRQWSAGFRINLSSVDSDRFVFSCVCVCVCVCDIRLTSTSHISFNLVSLNLQKKKIQHYIIVLVINITRYYIILTCHFQTLTTHLFVTTKWVQKENKVVCGIKVSFAFLNIEKWII